MKPTEEDVLHALRELRTLAGFENVRFIILFGSVAEGRATETSDIDLCIYYAGTPDEGQQFRFAALTLLCDDRYDIQIFGNLPLYVQKEVLRGRVLYCPDERFPEASSFSCFSIDRIDIRTGKHGTLLAVRVW